MSLRLHQWMSLGGAVAGVFLLSCGRYDVSRRSADARPDSGSAEEVAEHQHVPSARGGVLASLGQDEYHAEALLEGEGELSIFTFGPDETRVQEVSQQELVAYVKPEGQLQSQVIALQPNPLPGDSEGMTSRFSGRIPELPSDSALHITVPGLRIASQRFTARFRLPIGGDVAAMPAGVPASEADRLYLEPGGLYTRDDIKANGSTTAAEMYSGFRARHDLNPRAGDMLCPITRTKANAQCTWIIGGQTYEFCCPPCIDEFLALAKSDPEQILAPHEYRLTE